MDFTLPGGFTVLGIVWVPIVACAVGLFFGLLLESLRRRRVEASLREHALRSAKDRERAVVAERELVVERARLVPLAEGHQHLLASLIRGYQDLAAAKDKATLAQILARAVERVFDPAQLMIFVSADRDGREFELAASAGQQPCDWPIGGRLNDTMGRLGLVARRRAPMDRQDFESEPPIVREQIEATEPAEFLIDVAVPVVVGGTVQVLVAIGGSKMPETAARGGLELLATQSAALLRALQASARIERLKNTDNMTGLGSKSWFVAEGAEALYRCKADGEPAALAVFGIDDFKGYVDRSGHAAADRLLKGVADAIQRLGGDDALLARWSGAEFVTLLPCQPAGAARQFADRVRASVSGVDWPNGASQPHGHLTLSAGIAFLGIDGHNLDELVEVAVEHLSAARWSGDTTHAGSAPHARDAEAAQQASVSESPVSGPAPTE